MLQFEKPLPDFIKLNRNNLQLKPTNTNVGFYTIIITLTDNHPTNPLSTDYMT